MADSKSIQFSLIIPVYQNEADIRDLIEAINVSIATQVRSPFEVLFVIDGSPDRSRDLLCALLQQQKWPSQLIALSRNFGAFSAIRTGLAFATGDAIAVLAADLQEPATLVPQLWDILARGEADVVCAERIARNDGFMAGLVSGLFWWFYRKFIFPDMPKGGVSMFAFNARVKDSILGMSATNKSMFSTVMWLGFRRKFVPYVRQARRAGRSAYTFNRKLIYALDCLVSFSDLPILILIWMAFIVSIVSALTGLVFFVAWWAGWLAATSNTPIALMITFAFSILLLSQGILGLYVWRTIENTKQRPLSIVSEHLHFTKPGRIAKR